EGAQPDYVSVVTQVAEPLAPPVPRMSERQPDPHEANDLAENASAYRLGETLAASLHAYTDLDFYRFEVPGDGEQLLNIALEGEPGLGIQLTLTQAGADIGQVMEFPGQPG